MKITGAMGPQNADLTTGWELLNHGFGALSGFWIERQPIGGNPAKQATVYPAYACGLHFKIVGGERCTISFLLVKRLGLLSLVENFEFLRMNH